MQKAYSQTTTYWLSSFFLPAILLGNLFGSAQAREVDGLVTTGDLNAPGIGGIKISVKGASTETVSDNDGEYRIEVLGDESVLVYAYRDEANQLGIESEQLFAVRNVGYFKLDQTLRDMSGLLDILKKAKTTTASNEKKKLLVSAIKNTQKKTDYGRLHW